MDYNLLFIHISKKNKKNMTKKAFFGAKMQFSNLKKDQKETQNHFLLKTCFLYTFGKISAKWAKTNKNMTKIWMKRLIFVPKRPPKWLPPTFSRTFLYSWNLNSLQIIRKIGPAVNETSQIQNRAIWLAECFSPKKLNRFPQRNEWCYLISNHKEHILAKTISQKK